MTISNQVQLITYPDSLGGDLPSLDRLLRRHFADVFRGGVHILPPFPSSGDRGFAPLTYREIDPAFGTWGDIRRIGERFDVVVDLMVNHISRRSPSFQDFVRRGRGSRYADLFITLDKIWPGGVPRSEDVAKIFLRRPDNPFSTIVVEATGRPERVWTTFGRQEPSEQIDLDVHSAATRELLAGHLAFFRENGIRMVRLDAIGYVIKKPGTSCFMVEPEIYEFIDWIVGVARSLDLEVLPEVHGHHTLQARLADHGYPVYDFVLPGLVLYTLYGGSAAKLRDYLRICPSKQFTMLDCHDGIPIQPDLDGILSIDEMRQVVDTCLGRGANVSPLLSAHRGSGDLDAHQVNCTYYSALGTDDDAYVAARAIQFFAPGVPQVYYVGLLGGENDYAAITEQGEGRAINRHNYTAQEVEASLEKPVVQRLLRLIRFRNEHPAFEGEFKVVDAPEGQVVLEWEKGDDRCRLDVELKSGEAVIAHTAQERSTAIFVP